MEFNQAVKIVYYKSVGTKTVTGHIHYLDVHNRQIRIVSTNDDTKHINFSDITDVKK